MVKTVVVVFARNEENHLPHTLSILNRFVSRGVLHKVVVVNDASTDATKKIAESFGATVISNKTNLGKRRGFVKGAFKAKELGADVLVTLDADIQFFPQRTLQKMINRVTTGKKYMAIAQQYEQVGDFEKGVGLKDFSKSPLPRIRHNMAWYGHSDLGIDMVYSQLSSGKINVNYAPVENPASNAQRAINMRALTPLFRRNKKWLKYFMSNKIQGPIIDTLFLPRAPISSEALAKSKVWGLEMVLDTLIPKSKIETLVGDVRAAGVAARKGVHPVFTSAMFRANASRQAQDASKERIKQINAKRRAQAESLKKRHLRIRV